MDPEDILSDSPDVPEIPTFSDLPVEFALPWVIQLVWLVVLAIIVLFVFLGIRRKQRAEKASVAPILERARRAKAERDADT